MGVYKLNNYDSRLLIKKWVINKRLTIVRNGIAFSDAISIVRFKGRNLGLNKPINKSAYNINSFNVIWVADTLILEGSRSNPEKGMAQ